MPLKVKTPEGSTHVCTQGKGLVLAFLHTVLVHRDVVVLSSFFCTQGIRFRRRGWKESGFCLGRLCHDGAIGQNKGGAMSNYVIGKKIRIEKALKMR